MIIITDSREARNQHILEAFSNKGISFKVKKLNYGDYAIENYENMVIVERKNSLLEIAGNFTKGRKRFAAEFERAREAGAKIYLIIEDALGKQKMIDRQEIDKQGNLTDKQYNKTWKSNFKANSMIASLASWKVKYDIEIIFCDKKETGNKIIEIFNKFMEGENEN